MTEKNGFILLEIIVASAISGLILTALFTILGQVNNSVTRIDSISSIDMRVFLLQNQLERDLSGAFIIFERKIKEGDQKESIKKDGDNKSGSGSKGATQDGAEKDKKEQYEDVPLKRAFFSENGGENIKNLSFITNNPLKSFGKPKSLIARVSYKIDQDKELAKGSKNISFRLLRQESEYLSFDVFEKSKPMSYEVVRNIKKMSVEYTVAVKQEEKKEGDSKSQETDKAKEPEKEEKIEYKKFKTWTEKEIKSTKKQRPDFCKFVAELWDDQKKTYKTFEFKIYIYQVEQKPQPKPQPAPVRDVKSNVNSNINTNISIGKNNNRRNNSANKNNRKGSSIFNTFLSGKK